MQLFRSVILMFFLGLSSAALVSACAKKKDETPLASDSVVNDMFIEIPKGIGD